MKISYLLILGTLALSACTATDPRARVHQTRPVFAPKATEVHEGVSEVRQSVASAQKRSGEIGTHADQASSYNKAIEGKAIILMQRWKR